MNPTEWNILEPRKNGPQMWMSLAAFVAFWAILLVGVNLSVRELDEFEEDVYACILPIPADPGELASVDPPLQVGRSDPLVAGQAVVGRLEAGHPVGLRVGHYDAWTFSADEGELVVIAMDSDDVDAYLQILRDDGTQIAFDDDSGGHYNARVEFLAPETGQYTIVAASLFENVTGQYQIRLDRLWDG